MIESQTAYRFRKEFFTHGSYTVDDATFNAVITLDKIAKNLRKDRMKSGALSFDRVEVNLI